MSSNQQFQEAADPLFEVKNAFYTGNYQQCIVFAEKIKVNLFFHKT